MELKQIIADIRAKQGITQDEMAARLYVTRQAVSRWETGETSPNIDTLKNISTEFGVSPSLLLGFEEQAFCQSCGMDMNTFDDFGTEADGRVNADYCKYCYRQGSFSSDMNIDEMIESNLRFLDEYNKEKGLSFTKEEARVELKKHLSTLKRWQ